MGENAGDPEFKEWKANRVVLPWRSRKLVNALARCSEESDSVHIEEVVIFEGDDFLLSRLLSTCTSSWRDPYWTELY